MPINGASLYPPNTALLRTLQLQVVFASLAVLDGVLYPFLDIFPRLGRLLTHLRLNRLTIDGNGFWGRPQEIHGLQDTEIWP
jgi:hypothetical protein